jgi:hypothetical protein
MNDVLMLLMFDGARKRTVGHYRDLLEGTGWQLEGTGWQLERVVPSPGSMSVIEASRPVPRRAPGPRRDVEALLVRPLERCRDLAEREQLGPGGC